MKTFFVNAQLTHATKTPDLGYPEFFALLKDVGAIAPYHDGNWHIEVEDGFDHFNFKMKLQVALKQGDTVRVDEFVVIQMPDSPRC